MPKRRNVENLADQWEMQIYNQQISLLHQNPILLPLPTFTK